MSEDFESSGGNAAALFTLKLHHGEGMVLLGTDWKEGQPAGNSSSVRADSLVVRGLYQSPEDPGSGSFS